MFDTEIWKDIEGYETYQVSNLGRVRSLNYLNTGRVVVLALNQNKKDKYLYAHLHKNAKRKSFKVHRLMAIAFLPKQRNEAKRS